MLPWEMEAGTLYKGIELGVVKLMCLPCFPFYQETRREGPEQRRGKVEFHEDTHVQHAVVWTGICAHSCACRSGCLLRCPVAHVHTAHISPMYGEKSFIYAGHSFFPYPGPCPKEQAAFCELLA